MDLLSALHSFVRVAATGSFSAVSRETGVSQPTISRHIALLEAHYGTTLFARTTRSLTMTEDGRSLLPHAYEVLEILETAETVLGRRRASVSGLVRLGVTTAFGLCLARCGTPMHPRDLPEYPGVVYNYGSSRLDWNFERDGEESVIAPSAVFRANSSEAVLYAVESGLGIGLLPEFQVREAVADGRLTRLFVDWNIPSLPFYAVHTGPRTIPLRTRTVLDFLIEVSADLLREGKMHQAV